MAKALGKGTVLVVSTHAPALFAHDVHHPFRPQSDFWYLTGFGEPGAVVLVEGGTGRTTLWLRERDAKAEIWDGRRLGVKRAPTALGVDRALPIDGLHQTLPDVVGGRGVEGILDHDVPTRSRIRRALGRTTGDGAPVVAQMRLRKDADELRLLQKACNVGVDAMVTGAGEIRPGANERDVEAALLVHYRRAGSEGWGYPPIVGAGANAAILHYVENNAPIRDRELVLVDAGCSWGHYTCDITRTFPATRFTPIQADLYDIVEEAHRKAVAAVRPGNTVRDPHDAACRVLAEGLVGLGYLRGDPEALVREGAHRNFFMHGTSHFLGLDVHDAGAMRDADGKPRRLEEGMVLTVEPGLYFNPDFARCPGGTAGIGIRIEDDVAVTGSGRRVLTRRLPTARDAVESLVGKP